MYDYSAAKLAVDEPTPRWCGAVNNYIRFSRENQLSVRYIQNNFLLTWLVEASLRYERPKKCPTFLLLRGHYNLWQFCFSNVMGLTLNDLFLYLHRTLLNKW